MVNETRECSIQLLEHEDFNSPLIDIAFHHPVLTAKPLFEIFRAVIIEFIEMGVLNVSGDDKKIFRGVLKAIAKEYSDLVSIRNTLLHGTWQIGYSTWDDPNAENFFLHKYKPTSSGLKKEDVPKHAFELLKLKDRCEDARTWISTIRLCVPRPDRPHHPVAERFLLKNGEWHFTLGADFEPETLPRKSPEQ